MLSHADLCVGPLVVVAPLILSYVVTGQVEGPLKRKSAVIFFEHNAYDACTQ